MRDLCEGFRPAGFTCHQAYPPADSGRKQSNADATPRRSGVLFLVENLRDDAVIPLTPALDRVRISCDEQF